VKGKRQKPETAPPAWQGNVPDNLREPFALAFFAEILRSPTAARERAQRAAAVALAVGAALVAGGAFGRLSQRSASTQILGLCAVAIWLLTAAILIWATSRSALIAEDKGTGPLDQDRWAFDESRLALLSRDRVQRTIGWGVVTACAALTVTLGTVGAALADSGRENFADRDIALSNAGASAIGALCDSSPTVSVVRASVDLKSINTSHVRVRLPASSCRGHRLDVELPSGEVTAMGQKP
jgi:hypothetical protein